MMYVWDNVLVGELLCCLLVERVLNRDSNEVILTLLVIENRVEEDN